MSDFKPGLEGVVAFETEIAEPDKEGGSLRYRGVDIEELVGHVSFGHVWGLLVDNAFDPGLPPAEHLPAPARIPATSASTCRAARGPGRAAWSLRPLLDVTTGAGPEDVGRACGELVRSSRSQRAARTFRGPAAAGGRRADGR